MGSGLDLWLALICQGPCAFAASAAQSTEATHLLRHTPSAV